jgi:LemA protein
MKSPTLWIVVGLVVLAGLYLGSAYNGLVASNEGVDAQWAQVESQYQRRLDLVPNLVASVQGIMKQETTVFTALAEARTKYGGAGTAETKAQAANEYDSAFARLLVVMENYPQLRSVETVQSLMAELAGTENRIAVERMRYNELVRAYNVSVKTFPRAWVAGMFGFDVRTMYQADLGADVAPKVQL